MTWRDRSGNAVERVIKHGGQATLANGLPAYTRDSGRRAKRQDRATGFGSEGTPERRRSRIAQPLEPNS